MGQQYSDRITRGHPHNKRRVDGKPRFAKCCRICREERVTRY